MQANHQGRKKSKHAGREYFKKPASQEGSEEAIDPWTEKSKHPRSMVLYVALLSSNGFHGSSFLFQFRIHMVALSWFRSVIVAGASTLPAQIHSWRSQTTSLPQGTSRPTANSCRNDQWHKKANLSKALRTTKQKRAKAMRQASMWMCRPRPSRKRMPLRWTRI